MSTKSVDVAISQKKMQWFGQQSKILQFHIQKVKEKFQNWLCETWNSIYLSKRRHLTSSSIPAFFNNKVKQDLKFFCTLIKALSIQLTELTENITLINFHFTMIFANMIEEFFTIFTGVITNLAKSMNLKIM